MIIMEEDYFTEILFHKNDSKFPGVKLDAISNFFKDLFNYFRGRERESGCVSVGEGQGKETQADPC